MSPLTYERFLRFLQDELAIPDDAIATAERHVRLNPGPLPMILWQYGLVTLDQLDRIYDWLERA
ncbi:protein of unknown function (DUF2949) [Rubidibacter lacunae KORDI 51-2]|uniref:DUF2949 domain-containing protein n=1 Tax=Rubidibacter lacunae KORDI 51-2 TaxID=582515 RepID=U5DKY6_9CHRO|nr:DUF2949 domain-containing protein [Rubidibacter lacunae]ERN41557.1 protein of unknown function (DUF2949) [Rubidibacter lacunae KORDI 51-2]